MRKKNKIISKLKDLIEYICELYNQVDNTFIFNGTKLNLKNKDVKEISFNSDIEFSFSFYERIDDYRSHLKKLILPAIEEIKNNPSFSLIRPIGRIKNTNSVFCKICRYNSSEKINYGSVAISKCINDIMGVRVLIKTRSQNKIIEIVNIAIGELNNNYKYKIVNSNNGKYKGIHLYIFENNFSFNWEIQFWRYVDEKRNKKSHATHKQMYTNWENEYKNKTIIEVQK